MDEIINPYIAGAPVLETRMFFGREDVFDWIQNNLSGRYADHILVVHGQRRVGKTSVLKQLNNRLPKRYIPVFFDLQGRTHTTLDRFLWWLAREIIRVLKQDHNIDLPLPDKEAFTADPEYFENQFLSSLKPVLGDRILLLTFDEFDNLEESEIREELARPLIDYFRRLFNNRLLNFIFSIGSSGRKLENMQASYTEFFKIALYKKISFLTREQTSALVTRPVEDVLEYDLASVEKIYAISHGHPYFTQLICHELFSLCQKTGQRHLDVRDVESILDDVIERGTVNLKFTWDEASDLEKWILASLAHLDRTDAHSLAEFLKKQHVRFANADLNSSLLHLVEKDVLTGDYHFVIQLLKRWLQKNRPLEQVREELTEVNPIANRYIEIGLEFKNSSRYDRALESFQEALTIDSDNIQAQVSIAQVYMDQKSFPKAVEEFEKALTIDDEDVVARSGLCEAHLAIGDASMKKGRSREAVQSYLRILSINAGHTDARQRLADLNREAAEKALKEDREQETLSLFSEALKYTPEDPELIARVDAVKAEKNAREVKDLLARSEKEAAIRDWNSAINSLEAALRLAPDEVLLKDRLASLRESQKQSRLESVKTAALRAEEASRWEDAIACWKEYLSLLPGDEAALAAIERINIHHQQERLESLKSRALGLARAEKFPESLSTWEEYLALQPDERPGVEAEMDKVRKMQGLSARYADAQAAFARKDFETATRLFKDVVLLDENYKDASRRMAESVELRRTVKKPFPLRWVLTGLGLLVLVAVGWFASKPLLAWIAARPARTNPPVVLTTPSQPAATAGVSSTTVPTTQTEPTAPPTLAAMPQLTQFAWTQVSTSDFAPRAEITDIVVDGGLDGKLYVSTADAGVYRSIDGGNSWQPRMDGLGTARIDDLEIDPNNPSILYAVASDGTVYKTTDNGGSWNRIYTVKREAWFPYNLELAPWDSRVIFVGGNSTIYDTLDGGQNWTVLHESGCPWFIDFVVSPTETDTLFAAGYVKPGDTGCTGGIFKSTDSGKSWSLLGMSEYFMVGDGGLILGGKDRASLYVNAADSKGNWKAFRSRDGGLTWETIRNKPCSPLRVNPILPEEIYCLEEGSNLLVSHDSGDTWKNHPLSQKAGVGGRLPVTAVGPSVLIGGQLLYVSSDGEQTWEERAGGLPTGRLEFKLDLNDRWPLYLQAGNCTSKGDHPLYTSTGGDSWTLLTKLSCDLSLDSLSSKLYRLAVHSEPDKGGENWVNWDVKFGEGLSSIAVSPGGEHEIYVVTDSNKIMKSADSGKTWTIVRDYYIGKYARLFFDKGGKTFYANASFQFTDGGQKMATCGGKVVTTLSDSVIAVDPRDDKHLYAATSGQGVMESTNGCLNWTQLPATGNWTVNGLTLDQDHPDTMYAATDGGAFASFDAGKTWGAISEGLQGSVIYSIAIDKRSNVFAATPFGIFKLVTK